LAQKAEAHAKYLPAGARFSFTSCFFFTNMKQLDTRKKKEVLEVDCAYSRRKLTV